MTNLIQLKQKCDLLRMNFHKALDKKIDLHIITVRWFFQKKNNANVEVGNDRYAEKRNRKLIKEVVLQPLTKKAKCI